MKVKSFVVFFGHEDLGTSKEVSAEMQTVLTENFKAVEQITTRSFLVQLTDEVEAIECVKGVETEDETQFDRVVVDIVRQAVAFHAHLYFITEAQYKERGCCISKTLAHV